MMWLLALAMKPFLQLTFHGGAIHKLHQSKALCREKREGLEPSLLFYFPLYHPPSTVAPGVPLGTLRVLDCNLKTLFKGWGCRLADKFNN